MTLITMKTKGLLSITAAIGLLAASSALANTDLMTGQVKNSVVMEVSGDQRIVEIEEADWSAACLAGSMVTGDQRSPDWLMAGLDGIPKEMDKCSAHDYMMPMNR
ncbi:MAG: hypothetical protein H8K04_10995 [Nitrospira sp.]